MWDNITSAGAWEGRNANITNLKISFLSLDGKSCDCRSERGEENTERRAFFTLAGFRSFYRRRGQQKFRQLVNAKTAQAGLLIQVPKTLSAFDRHAQ